MTEPAPDTARDTTGRQVARAIDALRRGWPIAIDGHGLLAIETADAATLAAFDAPRPADLLIAGNRAATLKLTNQREALPTSPVIVGRMPWIDLEEARSLADPALDLANPFRGPFSARPVREPEAAAAALRLARLAGLLPALFVGAQEGAEVTLTTADIAAYGHAPAVRIASRAHLPVALAEDAEIVAFRSEGDTSEHVALLIGCAGGKPPLVRVHSECLTGDVFGSLKCDCGPQLRAALSEMKSHGGGILLYLRQEGRGIGLVNKLRAYALQDQGFDTVDANLRLGFGDDERDFGVAARMLEALGHRSIRLLTNNPRKVEGLKALGVDVVERVPLSAGVNPHNEAYLATKRDRSGHQL